MCIGIPMKVIATELGYALCEGRGEKRRVRTALVGAVKQNDWVLVFLESAIECLSSERAREINDTLNMLETVMNGIPDISNAPFVLPSSMDITELKSLAGVL